jgi:hypothetical protein
MSDSSMRAICKACLEWWIVALDFRNWFMEWVERPLIDRERAIHEYDARVGEFQVLRWSTINLYAHVTKSFGGHAAFTALIHNYLNTLDSIKGTSGSKDAFMLDLNTEIILDFCKALLDHVSPGTMTALPPPQASVANDEGNALPVALDPTTELARPQESVANDGRSAVRPVSSKQYDATRVAELKQKGYVCMSRRALLKKFEVSAGGTCVQVAARALRCERIRDVECHDGKLWVLAIDK